MQKCEMCCDSRSCSWPCVLPLLSQRTPAKAADTEDFVAEERFVDNGDGTVTDTRAEDNVAEGR